MEYVKNGFRLTCKNLMQVKAIGFIVLIFMLFSCSKETVSIYEKFVVNKFSQNNEVPNYDCTKILGTVEQITNALTLSLTPGSIFCIAPGVYKDVFFTYGGKGTIGHPIVLKAQVPGSVIVSGESRVRMAGSYITLQGIIFQDGNSGPSAFILLSKGGDACDYCRVTENTIIDWDQNNNDKNNWISIAGQYNRIDHNWISGKKNRGMMVHVNRRDGKPDYAVIDHNYFGDRPPFGGKAYPSMKDGNLEVIRLGASLNHEGNSFSRIEHNLFEKIRAETEIVSIKSSSNIIHGNTFRGSYGSVSNRHGSHNTYSNNFILGDGYPFAGGIRITGSDHIIVNNYIEGVRYPGTIHHGAIVLMAADDPVKYEAGFPGYKQVENVTIAHNTIVNSVSSFMFNGGSKAFAPRNIKLFNNVVSRAAGPVITHFEKGLPKDSFISNNFVMGSELTDRADHQAVEGFIYGDPMLDEGNNLARPKPESIIIGAGLDLDVALSGNDIETLYFDMDGQARTKPFDVGADQVSRDSSPILFPLTKEMVGPISYSPTNL